MLKPFLIEIASEKNLEKLMRFIESSSRCARIRSFSFNLRRSKICRRFALPKRNFSSFFLLFGSNHCHFIKIVELAQRKKNAKKSGANQEKVK